MRIDRATEKELAAADPYGDPTSRPTVWPSMPTMLRTKTVLFAATALAVLLCLTVAYAARQQPAEAKTDADPAMARDAALVAADNRAMSDMMSAMDVTPTGDADYDFASAMIPHHQGAIEMAMAELRFGKNEQLRRIAQEIIVDQQQEIAAMRLAIGCAGGAPSSSAMPNMQMSQ
jgi:uncharacterized protein (DUF305 family)